MSDELPTLYGPSKEQILKKIHSDCERDFAEMRQEIEEQRDLDARGYSVNGYILYGKLYVLKLNPNDKEYECCEQCALKVRCKVERDYTNDDLCNGYLIRGNYHFEEVSFKDLDILLKKYEKKNKE